MDFHTRLRYLDLLRRHTATPIPLMLDCFRLLPASYLAKLNNGLRFHLDGGHGEWHSLLECAIRMDYLQHGIQIGKGDTVIDIGANFGAFSIVAAKHVGKGGRVFSYEPNPSAFARLLKNIQSNELTNIIAYNEAVGKQDGEVTLYLDRNSAFSTAYGKVDGHSPSRLQSIKVKMRSMSSVLREAGGFVQLLKMDCEGSEYDILQSVSVDEFSAVSQVAMEVHEIPGFSKTIIPSILTALGFATKDTFPLVAFRNL
jgi:FkbM family methyltransferase